MKKTLLATAIAGAAAFTAAGAQAATVYNQDGTKLDIYGNVQIVYAGGRTKTVTPVTRLPTTVLPSASPLSTSSTTV